MTSRRAFIEHHGGVCRNWRWSWSFVNHAKRAVIFGAWDISRQGEATIILDAAWALNAKTSRQQPAYTEALSYLRLVETDGYSLWTFPMGHTLLDLAMPHGAARIAHFSPELSEATLLRQGERWLALPLEGETLLPDELPLSHGSMQMTEGGRRAVLVDHIERNNRARNACLAAHGAACRVCGLDFSRAYGVIGQGFIHVHHLTPLASALQQRQVDPVRDLVPVCPNCHAMLHRRNPPYRIEELKTLMATAGSSR